MELKIYQTQNRVYVESAHGHVTKFPEGMTMAQVRKHLFDVSCGAGVCIKLVTEFSDDFMDMFKNRDRVDIAKKLQNRGMKI